MRTRALVPALLLVGACSGQAASEKDDLGGMGVPQQRAGEDYPGIREDLTVRVRLADNGCFLGTSGPDREPRLVVWPRGTEQGEHGDELRLPDGSVVSHGDEVSGPGLLLRTDRLPGMGQDGYWAYAVGYCTPDAGSVLVLDRAVRRS